MRTCSDSTCSTEPDWKGPGGDGTTYFSELYNRPGSDIDTTFTSCYSSGSDICDHTEFGLAGSTNSDAMNLILSDFPAYDKGPMQSRFFQYRILMEAQDNSSCGDQACLPSTSAVRFGTTNNYYNSSPSLTSTLPLNITGHITDVSDDVSGGCLVKYQFSKDGNNFFYYNLGNWISASDSETQANSAPQISSSLKDFISSGALYIRAYLISDGTQSCELKNFSVIL